MREISNPVMQEAHDEWHYAKWDERGHLIHNSWKAKEVNDRYGPPESCGGTCGYWTVDLRAL